MKEIKKRKIKLVDAPDEWFIAVGTVTTNWAMVDVLLDLCIGIAQLIPIIKQKHKRRSLAQPFNKRIEMFEQIALTLVDDPKFTVVLAKFKADALSERKDRDTVVHGVVHSKREDDPIIILYRQSEKVSWRQPVRMSISRLHKTARRAIDLHNFLLWFLVIHLTPPILRELAPKIGKRE